MKFFPVLVHTIRFILRMGGKSDLTSEARERSMTSITEKFTFLHNSVAVSLFWESLERYVAMWWFLYLLESLIT